MALYSFVRPIYISYMQPTKNPAMKDIIQIKFIFALLICFSSCQKNNSSKAEFYTTNYKMMPIIENNHITKENHYVFWKPKASNNSQFLDVQFHGEIATLWFDKDYNCVTKKTSSRMFNLYWPQKSFFEK